MIPHMFMPFGDSDKIREKHSYLYHYTSIPAFYSMLENNQIWFGYTKNTNDESEVRGFLKTLANKINKSFPEDTVKKREVLDLISNQKETAHSFVLCFSKLKDDVAQWERYADNAHGVCLKFDTKILAKICDSNNYWMKEIVYSLKEKDNHNYHRLSCYIDTGMVLDSRSIQSIIVELGLIALYHKHPSFQSEQEVRIINYLDTNNTADYKYLETNNVIKRMLVFDLKQHGTTFEDLIEEIIIGPRSQQSTDELKMYLDHLGLHKLSKKIRESDCPLR